MESNSIFEIQESPNVPKFINIISRWSRFIGVVYWVISGFAFCVLLALLLNYNNVAREFNELMLAMSYTNPAFGFLSVIDFSWILVLVFNALIMLIIMAILFVRISKFGKIYGLSFDIPSKNRFYKNIRYLFILFFIQSAILVFFGLISLFINA